MNDNFLFHTMKEFSIFFFFCFFFRFAFCLRVSLRWAGVRARVCKCACHFGELKKPTLEEPPHRVIVNRIDVGSVDDGTLQIEIFL